MHKRKWTRLAEMAGLVSVGLMLASALFLAYGRLVALETRVRVENAIISGDIKKSAAR
jgi:hypothetical protein